MFSFLISLAFLVAGYIIYGASVNRLFEPDSSRHTPAVKNADGVDFWPLSGLWPSVWVPSSPSITRIYNMEP